MKIDQANSSFGINTHLEKDSLLSTWCINFCMCFKIKFLVVVLGLPKGLLLSAIFLFIFTLSDLEIWTALSHPLIVIVLNKTITGSRRRSHTKPSERLNYSSIFLSFCFQFEISNRHIFTSYLKGCFFQYSTVILAT